MSLPMKKLAAVREKLAPPERTIANELPQELSKLPEHDGFSDGHSSLKRRTAPVHGGTKKKAGPPKKAVAIPKTRRRTFLTAAGFVDDGHPTILAAARGLIPPS